MANRKLARPNNLGLDAYPEEVRERAFWVWFGDADRSPTRTAELLERLELAEADLDDRIPANTPDFRTIDRLARKDDWPRKAQEYLAAHAPARYHAITGRALVLLELYMGWAANLLVPGHPDFEGVQPNALMQERGKTLRHLIELTGVGMFGQKVARPEIPLPPSPLGSFALNAAELSEITHRKLNPPALPEGDE
jgi:hypothetical protein